MPLLIYSRYVLEEYMYGEFLVPLFNSRKFSDRGYKMDSFLKKLDESLLFVGENRYYYLQCDTQEKYNRFYRIDTAESYNTPSTELLTPRYISEMTQPDREEYIKQIAELDFIYNFNQEEYLISWIQIRDNLQQFIKICQSFKYRDLPCHNGFPDKSNGTRRTIIRNPTTGAVISDVTTSQTGIINLWIIDVNSNGIVYEERIYSATETFDLLTGRYEQYDASYLYYDLRYNDNGDITITYNYFNQDIIENNAVVTELVDPRNYTDLNTAGRFSTSAEGGRYQREVSQIKKLTLQDLFAAMNLPLDQY
jgi:hypothetical protein